VAYRVNDDFSVGRLVEDEIWIWRRRHAPNSWVIGHRASQRIPEQQIGDSANSGMDADGSLRGYNPESMQGRREREAYSVAS
jgi:hypothetical protein